MNEVELTHAVMRLVEAAVKDYILPPKQAREDNSGLKVEIINAYLPAKRSRSGYDDDDPFVVVKLENSDAEADKTTAEVSLTVGVYSTEFDGHEYCLNILSRIRNAICSLPMGTLENKYQLEYPVNITLPPVEGQPYPNWQADMTTRWVYNTPQPEFGREFGEFE